MPVATFSQSQSSLELLSLSSDSMRAFDSSSALEDSTAPAKTEKDAQASDLAALFGEPLSIPEAQIQKGSGSPAALINNSDDELEFVDNPDNQSPQAPTNQQLPSSESASSSGIVASMSYASSSWWPFGSKQQ
jgi:hypothetical protein